MMGEIRLERHVFVLFKTSRAEQVENGDPGLSQGLSRNFKALVYSFVYKKPQDYYCFRGHGNSWNSEML